MAQTGPDAQTRELWQLVSHLIEGVILIDAAGVITWANEAALAIHNCYTVTELGKNIDEYRQRFTLKYLNHHELAAEHYPMVRALSGEEFNDLQVSIIQRRQGDTHFKRVAVIHSMIFTTANGTTENVAILIRDETDKIQAEKRFERTFAVNPAPAIICQTTDTRFVKVNHGFLTMTGYRHEDIIGQSLYEIDVLRQAKFRDHAIQLFRHNESIPQQEAVLRTKNGHDKYVVVAGQPIVVANTPCMMFTFIDLDTCKQTQESLKQSKEVFSKAFDLAPIPMMICTASTWEIMAVNANFTVVFNYTRDIVEGVALTTTGLWQDTRTLDTFRNTLATQNHIRNFEATLHTASGTTLNVTISADSVVINHKKCVLLVFEDVTNRKRHEAELITAINAVMQDSTRFSQNLIEKLAQLHQTETTQQPPELSMLTTREKEILSLVCQGKSNMAIAKMLTLSPNTVRNHLASIYDKIDVHRRGDAIIWGRERGVTTLYPEEL